MIEFVAVRNGIFLMPPACLYGTIDGELCIHVSGAGNYDKVSRFVGD